VLKSFLEQHTTQGGQDFPSSNQRSYAEIQREREDAERPREEMELEASPGELVTLPSGIQYRELDQGKAEGKAAAGLALFTTLSCSQNTVQLMTAGMVHVNQSDTPRE
jgi:hypothetical protein